MNVEGCLPVSLQGPSTVITRVAAGLSGAGVYRVDAAGKVYVLKVASDREPLESWRCRLEVQRRAAAEGLAPSVVHADEERRATVSVFVHDQSFPRLYRDPRTHDSALVQLGGTLRRLHALPLTGPLAALEAKEPREVLASIGTAFGAPFDVPSFVGEAVQRVLSEKAPAHDRPLVLSHNDVNPTNLIYDGEAIRLLDWDTVGLNERYYDVAAIAVFLRMSDDDCRALLAAYEGAPVAVLPPRFAYDRRVVSALCGGIFLHLARQNGHSGASGGETFETTSGLGEVYQQMMAGALNPGSAAGQWTMGLALLKASAEL